jgi:hypothetical protein
MFDMSMTMYCVIKLVLDTVYNMDGCAVLDIKTRTQRTRVCISDITVDAKALNTKCRENQC